MNFSLSGSNPDQTPNPKNDKDKDKKDVEKYKKDWFDWWLSDDPPAPAAQEELRANKVKQANTYTPRAAKPAAGEDNTKSAPTNVTINLDFSKIKLPKVKPPKIKLPGLPYKRIAIVVIGLVIITVPAVLVYKNHQQQVQAAKLQAAREALANVPIRTTPSFTPVAPKNEPNLVKLSSTSKNTAYDGSRDTFSFVDNFDANNLTVSEQPLPNDSETPQQVVDKVAGQIGAKTPILLSGNNVAYLNPGGKSSSQQTVVFSIKNLLIFINSAFQHDAGTYKAYIDNLQ